MAVKPIFIFALFAADFTKILQPARLHYSYLFYILYNPDSSNSKNSNTAYSFLYMLKPEMEIRSSVKEL
jgi:hypothetical protein